MLAQPRKEKRLRVRRKDLVEKGWAKMNPRAVEYLGIKDKVEIVVAGGGGAGPKKLILNVLVSSEVPENEVWCNAEELKTLGIADNTIATVRAPLRPPQPQQTQQ